MWFLLICNFCFIGFNVETVEYKNISFTVWDVGGQDKVFLFPFPFSIYTHVRFWMFSLIFFITLLSFAVIAYILCVIWERNVVLISYTSNVWKFYPFGYHMKGGYGV